MSKLLFFLFSIGYFGFSQTIVIPQKLHCERNDDDFQLKFFLKLALEKRGFETMPAIDMSDENRKSPCDYLYADVLEDNKFLATKLRIVVYDCHRHEISQSEFGISREKEFKKAYQMAFRDSEKTLVIQKNNLKKIEKDQPKNIEVGNTELKTETLATPIKAISASTNENTLFAQPINSGFQLINTKPEIVCKIYKTTQPNYFIVEKNQIFGIGFIKENKLIIEYYIDTTLTKEVFDIKF